MTTTIHGSCARRFEPLRSAFAHGFSTGDELGAALAVTLGGESVVDLWAGHADAARRRPWQRDTIANVYSVTKGVVAILAHRLVESGRLDLDRTVAAYWPEFAAQGKEAIRVRDLLSHRAGLPAIRELLPLEALYDWNAMTSALAAQAPWWGPGTAHGYHAVTYGWLVGEVLRRITGKSVGTLLHDELAVPLDLDFAIGIPEADDARCADLRPPTAGTPLPPGQPSLVEIITSDPTSITALAFANPPSLMSPGAANRRAWRGAEIPGANGHGTARSLAKLYGAIASGGQVDGVHVLGPDAARAASVEHSRGPDIVLRVPTRFGAGFMLSQPGAAFGPNPDSFGHPGAGGSIAFADPTAGIGFSYVMNKMGTAILVDARAARLIEATYACL